ncbi:stage VI sporulation protein F [Bacillus solimangrovi]|uniref:Uncharacterized protein n=1 Tax=Bacillus solimangrovi TaxID=1305675 RepID=A0A1E5LHB2_9BACI|nr:stage VI sporulation protein F [Bacillus solimangrovi]OEH93465.1 hypothetical protein BFG57_00270 [Bacillus solimangrovi]
MRNYRSSKDEKIVRHVVRSFSTWSNSDLSKSEEDKIVKDILQSHKPLDFHRFRQTGHEQMKNLGTWRGRK